MLFVVRRRLHTTSRPRPRHYTTASTHTIREKIVSGPPLSNAVNEILSKSALEVARGIKARQFTATQVVEACLTQISRTSGTNAYITVMKEQALERARNIDARIANGESVGQLAGVPIAVKDNFCVKGVPATAASNMLRNFIAPYDSTVTSRLENEGAIIIGKTNMDEFGMGSTNAYSAFGPVLSPWSIKVDKMLSPGGSSGGSAAALAARTCFAAVGSDTGGSIRLPASWSGLFGIKPTYGRSSRFGLIQYASSLDTPALLTKNAEDAETLLEIISGEDPRDSTSVGPAKLQPIPENAPLTVGIPREYYVKEMSSEMIDIWKLGIQHLKDNGCKIVDVSLPHTQEALSAYYIIAPAEASSNLARYDGVRYGYRAKEGESVADLFTRSRTEAFGAEVQRRILVGTFVLSRRAYDSYYKKALQIRRLVAQDFENVFNAGVDVLLTPTAPTSALSLDDINLEDPVSLYLTDVMTVPANMAAIPAASVPVALNNSGLPVGLQLMAARNCETKILAAAKLLEKLWTHNSVTLV